MVQSSFNTQALSPSLKSLILNLKNVGRCHITLPDDPKPIAAVIHNNRYYAYVKLFTDTDSAERAIARLQEKGNKVVLTQTRRGLVVWVLEPDAHLAIKSLSR